MTSASGRPPGSMKAAIRAAYGPPDVLTVRTVPEPDLGDRDVLIDVRASAINAGDRHLLRGSPFLIRLVFGGLFRPRIRVLGSDVAGRVAAVGPGATRFSVGDRVFGDLSASGFGAFAQRVRAPEDAVVAIPPGVSDAAAGAAPVAAGAALQALALHGALSADDAVLVIGASGGVGSFATQLAKDAGAHVSVVCGAEKADAIQRLGPDRVIDPSGWDVAQEAARFDLVLDAAAYRPFGDYLPIIKPGGSYVLVGGSLGGLLRAAAFGGRAGRRAGVRVATLTASARRETLLEIAALLASGRIAPLIARSFALDETAAAIAHLESRRSVGKISLIVSDDPGA